MSKTGSKTPKKAAPKKSTPAKSPVSQKKIRLWLLGGGISLALFFYYLHPIMMPFAVAVVIAYALDPAVSFFERKGLGRSVATCMMVTSVLILIATLFFFTIPFLKDELHSLATTLPGYIKKLIEIVMPTLESWVSYVAGETEWQKEIQNTLTDNISKMINWVFTFLASLFTSTLALANLVSLVFLTPLLIFYLLRDWPKILRYIQDLVPQSMKPSTQKLSTQINNTLSGYFRGQLSVCLILAVYYVIALSILGLNFSFTVGLISGLLTFIPYVGFFIGFVAAASIALTQFPDLLPFFIVIGIYGAGNLAESFVLVPRLVGGSIGLHPVWVIFALLSGGLLMGFTGLLLAVPVTAILAVLLRFAINKYRENLKAYTP